MISSSSSSPSTELFTGIRDRHLNLTNKLRCMNAKHEGIAEKSTENIGRSCLVSKNLQIPILSEGRS
jgi:cytochrome c-type biogenesis protein CcmH/NrfF